MSSRDPRASAIYLHRNLSLPCFPRQEAGPAAIASNSNEAVSATVSRARAIEAGESDSCIGARRGVRQRVTVLSPLIPGLMNLIQDLDWRVWEGGAFPKLTADVIIVCRPLELCRGLRFSEAAEWLVGAAFGGGAVYSIADTRALMDEHERREKQKA
jgi:hypothetical protein